MSAKHCRLSSSTKAKRLAELLAAFDMPRRNKTLTGFAGRVL
jgi:hypothetical protein